MERRRPEFDLTELVSLHIIVEAWRDLHGVFVDNVYWGSLN